MSFTLPHYCDFPPFYTRQIHEATWSKQCSMWSSLILEYGCAKGIYELSIDSETTSKAPFFNAAINRRLSTEMLRAIVEVMVSKGQAEWLDEGAVGGSSVGSRERMRCLLHWRRPSEWAGAIMGYVVDRGMTNSVVTVYELFEGEDTQGEPFHRLPDAVWRRAIAHLEALGRAQLFDSEGGPTGLSGIKFFS